MQLICAFRVLCAKGQLDFHTYAAMKSIDEKHQELFHTLMA